MRSVSIFRKSLHAPAASAASLAMMVSTGAVLRSPLHRSASLSVVGGSSFNAATLAASVRYASTASATPPPDVLNDSRISNWCRRLWKLSANQSQSREPAASVDGVSAAPVELSVEEHKRLIDELRVLLISDNGRLPVALVDSAWQVVNSILPPSTQQTMSIKSFVSLQPTTADAGKDAASRKPKRTPQNMVSLEQEERLFEFLALLTELDVDITAVEDAVGKVQASLHAYQSLLQTLAKEQEAHGGQSNVDALAAASKKVMRCKSQLVADCFQVRNCGSPIFFTWLRYTASLENGMRRLMDFRKAIHAFDILCAKQITALSKRQLAAAASPSSDTAQILASKQAWITRQQNVTAIDNALTFLFHDFFSREWLVMEELTWHSTPPAILEQIMAAEGVHPFANGIADMKARLQPAYNRHLFAFFHPAVVEEPLIAVQVALTHGISRSVDAILGRQSPITQAGEDSNDNVDTAIFYSINSAQSALRGMDMGNLLIKRVVKQIDETINIRRRERNLKEITTYSTLSPVPGYVRWLATEVSKLTACPTEATRIFGEVGKAGEDGQLTAAEMQVRFFEPLAKALLGYATRHGNESAVKSLTDGVSYVHTGAAGSASTWDTSAEATKQARRGAAAVQYMLDMFQRPESNKTASGLMWWNDGEFTSQLQDPLLRSVAQYLYKEKKRGRILDPVGNFHVSNGATMLQLNYLGNCCPQGSRESGTVMVNYWYNIPEVGNNARQYETDLHVSVGAGVRLLIE